MITPSINVAVNHSYLQTGRSTLVTMVPYVPKNNHHSLLQNINAVIEKALIEEPPSVSGAGAVFNSAGGITMKQTPSPELTRFQMLNYYLVSVREAGDIDANTASIAWNAWKLLSGLMGKPLPVPDAAPGPDGQLLYAWNKEEHHLELEFFPNGPAEFFYLNRLSNETWEGEYIVDKPISQDVKARLKVFI